MSFWLAFGISEEFDQGAGTSISVLEPPWASFSDAADSLATVGAPVVGGSVTEANAYVVEADTMQEASSCVRAVFIEHETGPRVKLIHRDVPTRRAPPEPPLTRALNRIHGELCITHQIAELALTLEQAPEHRARLQEHTAALEDLGDLIRSLRGEAVPDKSKERSGSKRLGYGRGQIGGAESATFAGTLDALVTELSIARHELDRASHNLSPSAVKELHAVDVELGRFQDTVSDLQLEVGPSA